jgi:hypothetical protein
MSVVCTAMSRYPLNIAMDEVRERLDANEAHLRVA